jgi:phosphoribosylaminoimidazole carboxylase PurK protein
LKEAGVHFESGFVLKQAKLGYDGKGTFMYGPKKRFSAEEFMGAHPGFYGYAEAYAPFKKELAVVVARTEKGEIKTFPLIETSQKDGKCDWAVSPAAVTPKVARQALKIAEQVIKKFGGVGVFGVEMFLLRGGKVVVNEIAPRVHNSGHLTINGCIQSQFEVHWRAGLGQALSSTDLVSGAAAMVNILGKNPGRIEPGTKVHASNPSATRGTTSWIHWYGKTGETLGRKLGHVNATAKTSRQALATARQVRDKILI